MISVTETGSKITILYRRNDSGSIIMPTRNLVQSMFMAIDAALERLGDAARFVEVIKVTPLITSPNEDLISIKMVMAFPKSRVEKDFPFSFIHADCEGSSTALTQRTINCLQGILTDEANESRRIAHELIDAYRGFLYREQLSGNGSRCSECGTMRPQDGTGNLQKCPKCNPPLTIQPPLINVDSTCPKC